MKIKDIKRHLQPYSIMRKRQTTINHAFASAVAPNEEEIKKAVMTLGQDPKKDLYCVYCGDIAETWDHAFGLVKGSHFSGYGHVVGNLVPCCKKCNARKGNMNWKDYLNILPNSSDRIKILSRYFKKYLKVVDYSNLKEDSDYKDLENIKNNVFRLIKKADVVAEKIRQKIKSTDVALKGGGNEESEILFIPKQNI